MANRPLGFFVIPDGSKREWVNLSTSVYSRSQPVAAGCNDGGAEPAKSLVN